jgi:hypothetical protein
MRKPFSGRLSTTTSRDARESQFGTLYAVLDGKRNCRRVLSTSKLVIENAADGVRGWLIPGMLK